MLLCGVPFLFTALAYSEYSDRITFKTNHANIVYPISASIHNYNSCSKCKESLISFDESFQIDFIA